MVLNKVGMRMKMMGPGDTVRLKEMCEGIVSEKNADSDQDALRQMGHHLPIPRHQD